MYGTALARRAAGRKLSKDLQDSFGFSRGPYDRATYRIDRRDAIALDAVGLVLIAMITDH